MTAIRTGDVVEVAIRDGFAYALYTHKHAVYGAMLRISATTFPDKREYGFGLLFDDEVQFSCFFPLAAAGKRSFVRIVGNIEVPPELGAFPMFRTGIPDPKTGRVGDWWLWDGEDEWKVGAITDEQRKYPIRGVWNDTMLIERIESRWTPQTDPT